MSYFRNMATKYAKLGQRIKQLRKHSKLTQEQLAEKAQMDPKSIIEIEGGKRNPTLKTITNIAKSLNVPASELLQN